VQIDGTATILRFVVMFASGDGLSLLGVARNATDGASAMFGIGLTGLFKTGRAPFVLDGLKCALLWQRASERSR
jgi:hypothetical protein